MLVDIIRSIKDTVSQPEVKNAMKDIIDPCMAFVDAKVHSVTFFFQLIAILILIQVMATLFLIIQEIRRNV
jgi:hypothetical protein